MYSTSVSLWSPELFFDSPNSSSEYVCFVYICSGYSTFRFWMWYHHWTIYSKPQVCHYVTFHILIILQIYIFNLHNVATCCIFKMVFTKVIYSDNTCDCEVCLTMTSECAKLPSINWDLVGGGGSRLTQAVFVPWLFQSFRMK